MSMTVGLPAGAETVKRRNAMYASAGVLLAWVVIAAGLLASAAIAQTPQSKGDSEMSAAMAAARSVAQTGPTVVKLEDQATLTLPADYVFIPSNEAGQVLAAMGNRAGTGLLGMIFSTGDSKARWFVVASYAPSGYIKDDDAKDWNADDMLDQIKSDTEEANKERVLRGITELEVEGWVERPRYDSGTHQLTWSISSKDRGTSSTANTGINYNTYALGRDGYISMNLVTNLKDVESQKPVAAQLLTALHFNDGKRYADFNSTTDRVAAFGLAALVGGVAAKKLGLLALAAAFAVKFAKVLALGGLAIVAVGYKIYSDRKKASKHPEGEA
jgi:uncharacterized membrane-anchored protein